MKAQNTLQPKKKVSFSATVTSDDMQKMLNKSLGDTKAVARLTSTLISAVAATPKLQECDPQTIVAAALRGEGMGLVYGVGYYVVPYGNLAQFSPSYKGFIQLAISTGMYLDINAMEIREGEVVGRDPRTGRMRVDLSRYASDEEREKKPIVGYYAYYELKDGTFRTEYWSLDKLLNHADRYSPAFSLEKFRKLQAGELKPEEVKKLLNGTPWYDEGEGQAKMCKKTVLRQLLTSGYAPLSNEIRSIFKEENEVGEMPVFSGANLIEDVPTEALEAPQEAEKDMEEDSTQDGEEEPSTPAKEGEEGDPMESFFDQEQA